MLNYRVVGGVVGVAVGVYLLRRWQSSKWGYFHSDKSLRGQVEQQVGILPLRRQKPQGTGRATSGILPLRQKPQGTGRAASGDTSTRKKASGDR
jgi:hypothetical protein